MKTKKAFFKEAVKNIKTSGTIVPSSRFLIKKLLKEIDFNNISVIVEFGPGNGNVTKEILNRMHSNSKLICFEINDEFFNHLKQINDDRLILVNESAELIENVINKLNIKEVDCIISSLPLSNIPKNVVDKILQNSKKVLKNNGQFSQFQYSPYCYKKIKKIFKSENVKLQFEAINFPPAFIYNCVKK
ncbi:MAG: methyltransferase domain-containing protein [Flavobacteriaceae bacterium]